MSWLKTVWAAITHRHRWQRYHDSRVFAGGRMFRGTRTMRRCLRCGKEKEIR